MRKLLCTLAGHFFLLFFKIEQYGHGLLGVNIFQNRLYQFFPWIPVFVVILFSVFFVVVIHNLTFVTVWGYVQPLEIIPFLNNVNEKKRLVGIPDPFTHGF